eukprot:1883844-Rhodomonas_salina.2
MSCPTGGSKARKTALVVTPATLTFVAALVGLVTGRPLTMLPPSRYPLVLEFRCITRKSYSTPVTRLLTVKAVSQSGVDSRNCSSILHWYSTRSTKSGLVARLNCTLNLVTFSNCDGSYLKLTEVIVTLVISKVVTKAGASIGVTIAEAP